MKRAGERTKSQVNWFLSSFSFPFFHPSPVRAVRWEGESLTKHCDMQMCSYESVHCAKGQRREEQKLTHELWRVWSRDEKWKILPPLRAREGEEEEKEKRKKASSHHTLWCICKFPMCKTQERRVRVSLNFKSFNLTLLESLYMRQESRHPFSPHECILFYFYLSLSLSLSFSLAARVNVIYWREKKLSYVRIYRLTFLCRVISLFVLVYLCEFVCVCMCEITILT